jgi:hypothetical protein
MAVTLVTVVAVFDPVSARAKTVSKIVSRGGRFDTPSAEFGNSWMVIYIRALGKWSADDTEQE